MGFDQRAATWDASKRRQDLADAVAKAISQTFRLHPRMRLLDMGAGTGLLTRRLLPSVGHIVAVDTSEKMLEKLAESVTPSEKIERHHGDILTFDPQERYDGIVSSMTMHHIDDIPALFRRLYSLLKEGGFLAIADLMPEDGTFHDRGNEGVFHFGFDESYLTKTARESGFGDIEYRPVHTVRKEGGREYGIFLFTAVKPPRP